MSVTAPAIQTATAPSHTITRARQVLACCAILERAGCAVLKADAHTPNPRVIVDRRPRLDMRRATKISTAWARICVARLGCVQVEWCEPRARS
jgi:hypothetical protein